MQKGFDDYELTAGDVLRGARATLGLGIAQASEKLQISQELILNIEQGTFSDAVPVYLMNNIVRDYAILLNLDPIEMRAMYWKDIENLKARSVNLESLSAENIQNEGSTLSKIISWLGFKSKP